MRTMTARRQWRHRHRVDRILLCACMLLLVIGLTMVGYLTMLAAINDRQQAAAATHASAAMLGADSKLAAAEAYNRRLAASQGAIGEEADPFGNPKGDFTFTGDKDYQNTLDMGGGIMGVLKIPRISLELPIRHGAGEQQLKDGAGHLHGTSLPVGGKDTHTVLTGHRGFEGATLFTRLDELKEGDPIYVETMGRTIAYKVDRIYPSLTPQEATKHLTIVPGEDRLTLVTCTPIFVNTHRLLVSATRATMPGMVAYPDQAPGDDKSWLDRYWRALLSIPPTLGFAGAAIWPAPSPASHRGYDPRRRPMGRHISK